LKALFNGCKLSESGPLFCFWWPLQRRLAYELGLLNQGIPSRSFMAGHQPAFAEIASHIPAGCSLMPLISSSVAPVVFRTALMSSLIYGYICVLAPFRSSCISSSNGILCQLNKRAKHGTMALL
jgi:hypothetical protein